MTAEVTYIPSANWATLNGAYTPEELREIADKIEETYKEFNDSQK